MPSCAFGFSSLCGRDGPSLQYIDCKIGTPELRTLLAKRDNSAAGFPLKLRPRSVLETTPHPVVSCRFSMFFLRLQQSATATLVLLQRRRVVPIESRRSKRQHPSSVAKSSTRSSAGPLLGTCSGASCPTVSRNRALCNDVFVPVRLNEARKEEGVKAACRRMYSYVCIHTHTHTHTRAHACMHTYMHAYLYLYLYLYFCLYLYLYIYIYIYLSIYIYIYIYLLYILIHTHTHPPPPPPPPPPRGYPPLAAEEECWAEWSV